MKERLDVLVVERRLADSREKAKAIIMAGNVFVNGQREDKAGSMFDVTSQIEIHGVTMKFRENPMQSSKYLPKAVYIRGCGQRKINEIVHLSAQGGVYPRLWAEKNQ